MSDHDNVLSYINSLPMEQEFTAREIADHFGIKTQMFCWLLSDLKKSGVISIVKIVSRTSKGKYAIYRRSNVDAYFGFDAYVDNLRNNFNFGML